MNASTTPPPIRGAPLGGARRTSPTLVGKVSARAALVLALIASVGGATLLGRFADDREQGLRALRIEAQRLERRARRLADPLASTTLAALEETRDALRVRLVEALDGTRAAPGTRVLRHHVEERPMPAREAAATLRLTLEGRVAHGAALLDLIGAVRAASRPWPTETRGCLVQRLDTELVVDCTVDILHWRDLEAPHAG